MSSFLRMQSISYFPVELAGITLVFPQIWEKKKQTHTTKQNQKKSEGEQINKKMPRSTRNDS